VNRFVCRLLGFDFVVAYCWALASLAGICSGFFLGLYAAAVAYQENSTKSGLLYVVAVLALFDEYTNDFLYLREGSCFPRYGRFVKRATKKPKVVRTKQPPVRMLSMQMQELKDVVAFGSQPYYHSVPHSLNT
ncbi:hypothetical protein IFM89_038708, partial [Coptis chinensis]